MSRLYFIHRSHSSMKKGATKPIANSKAPQTASSSKRLHIDNRMFCKATIVWWVNYRHVESLVRSIRTMRKVPVFSFQPTNEWQESSDKVEADLLSQQDSVVARINFSPPQFFSHTLRTSSQPWHESHQRNVARISSLVLISLSRKRRICVLSVIKIFSVTHDSLKFVVENL